MAIPLDAACYGQGERNKENEMPTEAAQDKIIAALVSAAFVVEDGATSDDDIAVAHEIRLEATKMAKRWGISEVPGLSGTWPRRKKVPDYGR